MANGYTIRPQKTQVEFMAIKRNFKVALLVNLARNAPEAVRARANAPADALADLDSEKTGQSYADALRSRGHEVLIKEGGPDLPAWLAEHTPDICLNTCEGFVGDSREAQVPALLEMIGNIRYTCLLYTSPSPRD